MDEKAHEYLGIMSKPEGKVKLDKDEAVERATYMEIAQLRKLDKAGLQNQIPVFVVEEHCEALLCIHRAMRRGILPLKDICIVHFDAHPDLSLPQNLHPGVVFQPRSLLQKLRETASGIAEWMIPLVFANHVSRIVWVRSPWSRQLADGEYSIQVGVGNRSGKDSQQCLKVDCFAPYFADDGISEYGESMSCKNRETLSLQVVCLHNDGHNETSHQGSGLSTDTPLSIFVPRDSPLILDICLDYFTTLNPFLVALRTALNCDQNNVPVKCGVADRIHLLLHEQERLSPSDCCALIYEVMMRPRHRQASPSRTNTGLVWQKNTWQERVTRSLFKIFMRHALWKTSKEQFLRDRVVQQILATFGSHVFPQFRNTTGVQLMMSFAKMLKQLTPSQIEVVRDYISWCDLPHKVSTQEEVESMIQRMILCLKRLPTFNPLIVTIACSASDGFVPIKDVRHIIANIREALHDCFGKRIQILPEPDVAKYL